MSVRLVLTQYLASLRERDELDALLPELLVAMGHTVISRPQVGVRQAGVDVLSSFPDGPRAEAFMFVIKFGDIGRNDMFMGPQSIDASVREVVTDYARSRLPPPLNGGRKHIVVVTSGVLRQDIHQGFKGLAEYVAEQPSHSLELWDIDGLTQRIEEHLLNESLLLRSGRSHLRSAIATLEDLETATHHFRHFVDSAFVVPGRPDAPLPRRTRAFLKQCAAAEMGWTVFNGWARQEDNLKPSADGCEYLLLRIWAEAVRQGLAQDAKVLARIEQLKGNLSRVLDAYIDKIGWQLMRPSAVMSYAREWVLYNRLVLEEAGRFGLFLLLAPRDAASEERRRVVTQALANLFRVHTGCRLPVMDGQAVDLSLALAAFMSQGDRANASGLAQSAAGMFKLALDSGRYIPVDSDLIEDALAVHEGEMAPANVFKVSTLIPMLATVAALIGDEVALRFLREHVHPAMPDVTLERWFPAAGLDQHAAHWRAGLPNGVSVALSGLQPDCAAEVTASMTIPAGAAAPEELACMRLDQGVLIAISARLFQHPLPTWYLEAFRLHPEPSSEPVAQSAPE